MGKGIDRLEGIGTMKNDLISRQAVLENAFAIYTHECGLVEVVGVATIKDLPSVKPQTGHWITVSERLPEEDGDYFVTYEKGYAEDYNLPPIGIVGFEVDCESFGYWHEHFDRQTLGSLGSEWEEIKVIAWMPLPEPWKGEKA